MNEDPDSIFAAALHSGWVASFLTATWGIVLRVMIGGYIRRAEKDAERWKETNENLSNLNGRIARIEGHLGINQWEGKGRRHGD